MKRLLILSALALLMAVNALVLAGVAWNRSGEPEAVLVLTERELRLPWHGIRQGENSGVSLTLARPDQSLDWLDETRLASLGFNIERLLNVALGRGESQERDIWAVLEFDGPAHQQRLAEQAERIVMARAGLEEGRTSPVQVQSAETALERMQTADSRLLIIDAGLDAAELRQRYPDRGQYAIVRAQARANIWRSERDVPLQVRGWITRIEPGQIHLPRQFHAALEELTPERSRHGVEPPRFSAEVHFGRRYEPWVVGISPLE